NEFQEVLWQTTERFPSEQWASQALEVSLYLSGKTHTLFNLYSARLKENPKDPAAMNDVAAISMLLSTNTETAFTLARHSYAIAQTNLAVVSTYAYSLHLQGQTTEALNLMSKLTEPELRQGSMAAYYAILLNAAGQRDKAKPYVDL